MHELSVCQALIDQVLHIADENNAASVTAIHLQIGPLSGIEAPLLQQAYSVASAGTLAEAAVLKIESCTIMVKCNKCGKTNAVSSNNLSCPDCSNWQTTLVSGDELLLKTVELERKETEHV